MCILKKKIQFYEAYLIKHGDLTVIRHFFLCFFLIKWFDYLNASNLLINILLTCLADQIVHPSLIIKLCLQIFYLKVLFPYSKWSFLLFFFAVYWDEVTFKLLKQLLGPYLVWYCILPIFKGFLCIFLTSLVHLALEYQITLATWRWL